MGEQARRTEARIVAVRLPLRLYCDLDELARREERSVEQQITRLIRVAVEAGGATESDADAAVLDAQAATR